MNGVEGFMYPNEIELQWSVLIVLYPFITGLVAGRIHPGVAGTRLSSGGSDSPPTGWRC